MRLLFLFLSVQVSFGAVIIHPQTIPIASAGGGGGGGNDITFRSQSAVVGTGSGATPTEPSGATTDDVLIAIAACDSSVSSLGIPAGWTSLYSGSSTTPKFKYNICYIRRTSSAPSYAFTTGGSSVYREVHVLCYSGVVNSGNPHEASSAGTKSSAISSTVTCDSVTTLNANAMVLAIAIPWAGSNPTYTAPNSGGYTIRTRNTAGDDVCAAEKKRTTAGAESPGTIGGINAAATDDRFVATIALQD
jgi:hypothetical protein